ncbi:1,3-beta-glucan synthase component-domain-containing protein, partial [Suillus plorans]
MTPSLIDGLPHNSRPLSTFGIHCGNGRDLGFGTILNFQTKMVFMVTLLFIGTLNKQLAICQVDAQGNVLDGQQGSGCYNLIPVFEWIKCCIVSIFLVFFAAFLPLFLQELVERETGKALLRLGKHFLSLSPVFEVFSTQLYSQGILSNLTFGGARYIATGRGFATTRISFSILYSCFAGPGIYMGMRNLLILLYVSLTIWIPHLIYFRFSVLSLCIAPFVSNPHQFSFTDFIIDYREFLRWIWYGHCRLSRTMITGYKKKKLGFPSEKLSGDLPRASWRAVVFPEVVWPICHAAIFVIAYMFVKSFPNVNGQQNSSPLIRIAVIAIGPIVWNAAVLISLFFISLFVGPMFDKWARFASVMAAVAHLFVLLGIVSFFEFFWFLELWDASHAVLRVITIKFLIAIFLSREFKHDETNRAWWSGKWYGRGLGNTAMSQPACEFIIKIVEMSLWSSDFLLGHILLVILTPPVLIPFIDKLHSTMLFWLRPSKQIRAPLYSTKQKRQRRWIIIKYTLLYILAVPGLASLIVLPAIFRNEITFYCTL